MLHFVGRPFSSSDSSTSSASPELCPLEVELRAKKDRARSEDGVVGIGFNSSLPGISHAAAIASLDQQSRRECSGGGRTINELALKPQVNNDVS
jgi:hypothetical protein